MIIRNIKYNIRLHILILGIVHQSVSNFKTIIFIFRFKSIHQIFCSVPLYVIMHAILDKLMNNLLIS
jgi:hypothetical protein